MQLWIKKFCEHQKDGLTVLSNPGKYSLFIRYDNDTFSHSLEAVLVHEQVIYVQFDVQLVMSHVSTLF